MLLGPYEYATQLASASAARTSRASLESFRRWRNAASPGASLATTSRLVFPLSRMTASGRPEPASGWIRRAGEGGVAVGRCRQRYRFTMWVWGKGASAWLVALLVVSLLLELTLQLT